MAPSKNFLWKLNLFDKPFLLCTVFTWILCCHYSVCYCCWFFAFVFFSGWRWINSLHWGKLIYSVYYIICAIKYEHESRKRRESEENISFGPKLLIACFFERTKLAKMLSYVSITVDGTYFVDYVIWCHNNIAFFTFCTFCQRNYATITSASSKVHRIV